jgi:hypothetical protein
VKTDEEYRNFHPSKRTLESCRVEFNSLKDIYIANKQKINDFYDKALVGSEDPLFNVSVQKEFYGERLHIIENARHNPFFRIKNYEQLFKLEV